MESGRSNSENIPVPQPIDYGMTYDETFRALYVGGTKKFRDELPEFGFGRFTYKQGDWVKFYSWPAAIIWFLLYVLCFSLWAFWNPQIRGGWVWNNPTVWGVFFGFMLLPGFLPFLLICAVVQSRREKYLGNNPPQNVRAFLQALQDYKFKVAAADEAGRSELEVLRTKRSYWEQLDGYEFERETAAVLEKYQFNPRLTGGSADGGVDIEVQRNGRYGVVQCKAHAGCIGPHTVRDLFGVIHHSNAQFGIIVSRGGFTKGAVEFATNKPILLVDCSDLIAMQEGQDVLGKAFP